MQVLCGTSLAVGSFGLQVWLAPYRQPEANVLKAAVDLQIFLTFLVSFMLRALDATPASAGGLGLASFEPELTQEPTIRGGPAVFYGWVLVGSLGLVLALAAGLTMSQLQQRRRWLASTARGAELQQVAMHTGRTESDRDEALLADEQRDSVAQLLDPARVGDAPPAVEMLRRSSASTRWSEALGPPASDGNEAGTTASVRPGAALVQPLMGDHATGSARTPVHEPGPTSEAEPVPEAEPEAEAEPQAE